MKHTSKLFTEFIVQLLKGFEKVFILLTYKSNNFNFQEFKE